MYSNKELNSSRTIPNSAVIDEDIETNDDKESDSLLRNQPATSYLSPLGKYFSYLNFPWGSSHFIFSTLWPTLFYLIFFNDLREYDNFKDEPCATNLNDIFLGTANDPRIVTSLWGSDKPYASDNPYTAEFIGGMVGLNLVWFFAVSVFSIQCLFKRFGNPRWEKPLTQEDFKKLCSRIKNRLWPNYAPQRLEYELLKRLPYNLQVVDDSGEKEMEHIVAENLQLTHKNIYKPLEGLSENPSLLVRWRGRKSLYRIANLSERKLNELKFDEDEKKSILAVKGDAASKLYALSQGAFYNPETIHAQYLFWKTGSSPHFIYDIIYGFFYSSFLISWSFATARYIEAVIFKWISLFGYSNKCDLQWDYVDELGGYDCTLCGDWTFVFLKDRYSSQGCLNGLLISNASIIDQDFNYMKPNEVVSIDLSKRDFGQWNDEEFLQIFRKLSVFTNIKELNLSQVPYRQALTDNKLRVLKNFVSHLRLDTLDLKGLELTGKQIQILFNTTHPQSLVFLNVAENQLATEAVPFIKALIIRLNVSAFNISCNPILPEGISSFAEVLPDSNLTTLIWQQANFNQYAFDDLFGNVTSSRITAIDVSDSHLDEIDMSYAGTLFQNASLENLTMSDCQLKDRSITVLSEFFSQSKLRTVNFNRNYITQRGAIIFFENIRNSSIHTLYFRNPTVNDIFLFNLLALPNNLTTLDMASQLFTSQGLTRLIQLLPNTLRDLILSQTPLDDNNLEAITYYQAHNNSLLSTLDIGETDITDTGIVQSGCKLLSNNYTLRSLRIRGNPLSNKGIISLASCIASNRNLMELDVSNGNYDAEGAKSLIGSIVEKGQFDQLSMDNIPVGDNTAVYLAKSLITSVDCIDDKVLVESNLSFGARNALAGTNPKLTLRSLSLKNASLTQKSANAFGHVLPHSSLSPSTLNLGNNAFAAVEKNNLVSFASNQTNSFLPYSSDNRYQRNYQPLTFLVDARRETSNKGNAFTNNIPFFAVFGFSALLMVFIVFLYKLFDYFYQDSNQSSESISFSELNQLQKMINQLSEHLTTESLNPLGLSCIFEDKFEHFGKNLHALQQEIVLIYQKAGQTHRSYKTIKDDLNTIQQFITHHCQQNKCYLAFLKKEQQVAQRNQQTGKTSRAIIHRSIFGDQLRFEIRDENCNEKPGSFLSFSFFNRTQSSVISKFDSTEHSTIGIKN
jgi:hypothetical protein